jgi:hypothetical protein
MRIVILEISNMSDICVRLTDTTSGSAGGIDGTYTLLGSEFIGYSNAFNGPLVGSGTGDWTLDVYFDSGTWSGLYTSGSTSLSGTLGGIINTPPVGEVGTLTDGGSMSVYLEVLGEGACTTTTTSTTTTTTTPSPTTSTSTTLSGTTTDYPNTSIPPTTPPSTSYTTTPSLSDCCFPPPNTTNSNIPIFPSFTTRVIPPLVINPTPPTTLNPLTIGIQTTITTTTTTTTITPTTTTQELKIECVEYCKKLGF